eukprot:TRINITY_DN26525_c0_g1_i6.p1 TRINITY_DN26525_c0_g1~~TRINITY_DN26525_c0_g1_i6.p1  ORF type:complete len:132 (+),score=15.95 TRINITY_DN26525_c0_g1_i6:143-538(+)
MRTMRIDSSLSDACQTGMWRTVRITMPNHYYANARSLLGVHFMKFLQGRHHVALHHPKCTERLLVPDMRHDLSDGFGMILLEERRHVGMPLPQSLITACLLYTSDAADEEDSVDLGGRRIIKKKKKIISGL